MNCKYRVRYFSSKGAFLVLLWTWLTFVVGYLLYQMMRSIVNISSDSLSLNNWFHLLQLLLVFLSPPLSGWLADAKFGNYKVFRVGAVLLFIAAVINCLFLIIEKMVLESSNVLKWIHLCCVSCFFIVGGCACFVTALPLGVDQMPDASSSSITSYIAWFVCSIIAGTFPGAIWRILDFYCWEDHTQSSFSLYWALFLVFCISTVLISNFLFSPKWLIIEPKSPQSLKTIYLVLKFAARHKAPLNRSALTYWEEDIPSRIDLGKSKYGGPFTTEQVENVKTILNLLAISIPIFFISFSASFQTRILIEPPMKIFIGIAKCNAHIYSFAASNSSLYGILGAVVYEFLLYPLVWSRLPSILKGGLT